ncbi:hypothetical protein Nepgr_008438 [Nepenthes gracilis]|uniref:Uncharacterized protein n=1 Tax=Nepenthes gracilis TaxID=150966 RepID=A0AAD3XJ96_NEPGR|nr:hypothetical protein Nepgr_008438 [Nepenthes gracilis]
MTVINGHPIWAALIGDRVDGMTKRKKGLSRPRQEHHPIYRKNALESQEFAARVEANCHIRDFPVVAAKRMNLSTSSPMSMFGMMACAGNNPKEMLAPCLILLGRRIPFDLWLTRAFVWRMEPLRLSGFFSRNLVPVNESMKPYREVVLRYPMARKLLAAVTRHVGLLHMEVNGVVLAVDGEGKPAARYNDRQLLLISSGNKRGQHL